MMDLTRREWLSASAALAGGLALPAGAAAAPVPVRLALNENPFGPSPLAIQAIREHLDGICRYVGGEAERLAAAIAEREGVPADRIVLGEILDALGLHLALQGGPGGEFVYSEPGYTALVDAVAPGGGTVIGVPLDGSLRNDLPAIGSRVGPRTRAVYLVNPHNPTGTVSDAAAFIDFVRETSRRALVIVDEAYLEFEPDFAARTVAGLVRAGEQVVVFRTFGKIYGLAGLSIGYAMAPAGLAALLKRNGIGAPHALNNLALAAAAASLQDSGYIAATRDKIVAEREKWHALLRSLRRPFADARGNFVFFDAGRPHDEIASALAAKGIEIGRAFPPYDNWLRISIGLPDEHARVQGEITRLLG
jgi:histidinol-phosphate aminotransferase